MFILFFKKITFIFRFVRKILKYKLKSFEEYYMYIYTYITIVKIEFNLLLGIF